MAEKSSSSAAARIPSSRKADRVRTSTEEKKQPTPATQELVISGRIKGHRKDSIQDSPSVPKPKGGQDEPAKKRRRLADVSQTAKTAHVKAGPDSSEDHSLDKETEGLHSQNKESVPSPSYGLKRKQPQ